MKKFLSIIAVLAVTASLCSCGGKNVIPNGNNAQNDSTIVANDTNTTPTGEEYTYDHMTLVLPEGFTVNDDMSVPIAYGPNYPTEADSIAFTKSGADDIDNYNKEVLEEQYKTILNGFEEIDDFKKIKIDSHDAIKISYSLSISGVDMEQTQYCIFGDSFTDVVTFCSVTDNYKDAFEDCAKTITVD